MIEKYGVTIFYTAPTAIRAFMKWGTEWPAKHDMSSLRLIGSVGEPINPEAWVWYYQYIGGEKCPVVDTWWQTETGAIMISPLPGVTTLRPGSATRPLPGIAAELRTEKGEKVETGGGLLALTRPWPSMLRGIYGDPERYVRQYWNKWGPDVYVTGDGAKRDADGNFWLLGRVDDVINVAGHRIGTMEVESALVDHPSVAEAAVVGRAHEIKGQAIAAFVTLKEGIQGSKDRIDELKDHVVKKIGAIARPDDILFTADLPKTRSGKIMRRLLRDIAEGKALGDTTTLADPSVVAKLKSHYEEIGAESGPRPFNAVAAQAFRARERRFGLGAQPVRIRRHTFRERPHGHGAAHRHARFVGPVGVDRLQSRLDGRSYLLRELTRLIHILPRQEHGDLIVSELTHPVGLPEEAADQNADALEHAVAGGPPVCRVDARQTIDVEEEKGERLAAPRGATEFFGDDRFEDGENLKTGAGIADRRGVGKAAQPLSVRSQHVE